MGRMPNDDCPESQRKLKNNVQEPTAVKELRTFTGKGSSPHGLSPPPSESPAPTFNSWQVAVEGTPPLMRGESDIVAHSIFELLCQKVLLSWYRFLSSNHRYQFQSMTTKIKLNKEARRTKQKGGQTTTAAGLRRGRQAKENLCLLRHAGNLRARLGYPEEVHTLPVLPSQWEHIFPICTS